MPKIDTKIELREKALLSQRLLAFIFDALLCLVIIGIISMPINRVNPNREKLYEEMLINIDKQLVGEISFATLVTKTTDIAHDIAREDGLTIIMGIIISVGYFILLPFYNRGQTVGKKIFRIRIDTKDEGDLLTMNNFVVRALLVNGILITTVILSFALLTGKEIFLFSSLIFGGLQLFISLVCLIGIIVQKEGKGLHDLFAGTMVVRDRQRVKEELLCEN